MKSHIGLISVLTVLAAVLFLSVLISCNDRGAQLRQALAAADSLMMTDPLAALDTLLTIDSADAARLPRADRALYTLLRTEAGYKCWLPVAENTAISEAVDYYRRKGPEDRLARALVMQGVVLSEQGDTEGAMLTYKEAEPLLERSGDLEQLGLLHTHIASLYQTSIVNDKNAILRYRQALQCFEKAGLPERIMFARIALARVLMIDSMDKAVPHIKKALSMAEQYGNRLCALSALELLCYTYEPRHDARKIINLIRESFSLYGDKPQSTAEENIYNNLLYNAATNYIYLGKADSARLYSKSIQANCQADSLLIYSLYGDIAELEDNNGDLLTYLNHAHRIELEILEEGYDTQLRDSELRYDHSKLEAELYKRDRSILFLILLFIISSAIVYAIIHILRRLLRQQKIETEKQKSLAENLKDTATELKKELDSQKSENDSLAREKHLEEEERKKLEQLLLKHTSSNTELMRYYNTTYNTMRQLIDIYDIHQSNPGHLLDKSVTVAREFIATTNSFGDAKSIINSIYPGFLDKLFGEFPKLNKNDKYLIILTCLGYSNSIISSILGISETNLSTKKTRLAKNMNIDKSLTKYLSERLTTYQQKK